MKIFAFNTGTPRLWLPKKFLLVMKITTLFVFVAIMQVSAVSFAQKINLSETNVSLKKLFNEIRSQSGYNFVYTEGMLKNAKPVNIQVTAAMLDDVLHKVFAEQPLTYTIINNTVVIKEKEPLTDGFFVAALPFAAVTVSGRVLDEKNQPIPGVSVLIKGTQTGTVTDVDGKYHINIPDNSAILVFNSIGFVRQEVPVAARRQIDVVLKEELKELNQVVVTALGIKREEKTLGYAITKIDSSQLTDAVSGNWLDALSGKVAGLNMIRSNGGPTGSNKVILRGENNLTGENEALIVVDGVVVSSGSGRRTATGGSASAPSDGIQPVDFGSGINDINPEDIESVTVLKGPGAAALYGQRGANGAIIITTKSGNAKRKSIGITFTSNTAFESANRWPDLQYQYGQGLNGTSAYSYGSTADGPSTSGTSLAWGPRFNGQSFFQYDPVTQTTATERTPWVAYPNQIRDFFQTGKTYTNSLSLNGNFKKTTYRLSATHGDNTWIIPNTGYSRTNVSLSTNTKITPKLNLSVKANYTNKYSNNLPGMGYGNQSVMYWYVFWVPNADINWLKDYWVNGKQYEELKDIYTTSPENPYAISYEFLNGSNRNGVTGNAQLTYAFTKELSLQVRGTVDRSDEHRTQKRPWTAARLPTGSYRTQDISVQEITGDFLLKYDKQLNNDFHITASAGGSMLKNHYYKGETRADALTLPNDYSFDNATNALVSIPDTSRFSINSFYGLLSTSYKNYLYLDVTGRQDWSSVLATPYRTDNVGFFYPSASLSFIASEYFKLPRYVDFAKFRLSASQVGSGGTTPYRTAYLYGLAANGTYPDGSLQNPTTIPNPNLKPLKTTTYEVGTEVKLFKNRLGFDVAVYSGSTKNQILERIVDRASGYTREIINAGQINNSGVEIALNGTPISGKVFKWTSFMTFSTNKNKIIALANTDTTVLLRSGPVGGTQIVAKVGGSMGDMYGIGYQRSPDGQVIYDANSGLPQLTSTPIYLGNTNPKYKGSFGNDFTFKQFSLSVLFDAQYGGVGQSYTMGRLADFGKLTSTLPGRYSGIIGKGVVQNPDGTYRTNNVIAKDITTFYSDMLGTANGEGATYKTDFIKFREARIDYKLPKSVLKKLDLSRVTIGLYGRNLFIWSKWPLFDPEFGTLSGTDIVQGFEIGQFPSTRIYGVNLVVGFN